MNITREILAGYLEDALCDVETARVEQALRQSDALRRQLRQLMDECDRGDHSLGSIWRRERLTCLSRAQLGSFLLGVLESALADYVEFHLQTIGCAYCQANLADLKSKQQGPIPKAHERQRRFFESSAGLLQGAKKGKKG
jgi:hypothetical protein